MVGAPGPGRMVPAPAFANAPRMHDGGWAGLVASVEYGGQGLPLLAQMQQRYGDGVRIEYRQRAPEGVMIDFIRQ